MTTVSENALLDQGSASNLSFAVLPIDDFTGDRPIDLITISIKEPYHEAIVNNSGYYLFPDLDESAKYTVNIESDSEIYIVSETTIDLATLRKDPNFQNNPIVSITLLPNTSYPFQFGTTLVRGMVQAAVLTSPSVKDENKPVEGAQVKIVERNLTYLTNKRGEYIFYFKDLTETDIIQQQGPLPEVGTKNFIKMNGSSQFTLIVDHPDYIRYEQNNYKVQEGQQEVINISLKPK